MSAGNAAKFLTFSTLLLVGEPESCAGVPPRVLSPIPHYEMKQYDGLCHEPLGQPVAVQQQPIHSTVYNCCRPIVHQA